MYSPSNSAPAPVEEAQEGVIKHDQSQHVVTSNVRVGVEHVEGKKKKKKGNTKPGKKRGTGFEGESFAFPWRL